MLLPSELRRAFEEGVIQCSEHFETLKMRGQVRVNSIDLTLHDLFYRRNKVTRAWEQGCEMTEYEVPVILPGESLLGITREKIGTAVKKFNGQYLTFGIDGRSTIARHFLNVHSTAGFGDVGYYGHITLELTNLSQEIIILEPGLRICQVYFQACDGEVDLTYDMGHYSQGFGELEPKHILPKVDLFYNPERHGGLLLE